jgi:large subunit ribosomal protein L4e
VWTKSAFEQLDSIFGTHEKKSVVKKNYVLPRPIMGNPDLARIINSDEIQSVVRPTKVETKRRALKKNPLKNLGALLKLNPYAKTARRMELLAQEQRVKAKAEKLDIKRKTVKVILSTSLMVTPKPVLLLMASHSISHKLILLIVVTCCMLLVFF